MIKFFRKIRQNLLMENKTGKYLKYAIGEIILVIIGILIALSINNWNTNRKLKSEEQNLLKDLRVEVKNNIDVLSTAINEHEKSYAVAQEFKSLFKDRDAFNSMPESSFVDMYYKMNMNWTYDPNKGILKSMISSGQINNLSNKELKYLLASLEDIIIDALEDTMKIEKWRDELITKFIYDAHVVVDGKIERIEFKRLYDNPDFRLLAVLFDEVRNDGLIEERKLKKSMNHILELIEMEIKK
ncbi:hypothetical protein DIS18_05245 [Algibacter marinivivus]|uniref:Uncharacterized protein n=2 Tax=Algibacter marinivivus TaxID=2100723 RepID=A0A2U2X824_9FLAO|nr:hypothetical protein DIS18_05245 [Algibacter marinivivus]